MKLHKSGDPFRRTRLFTVITIAVPVFFFALLECALRLAHYGEDLRLFKEERIGTTTFLTMNPGVKGRYFSQTDFQPGTAPDAFTAAKPAGTLRLFCLGESTTVGYPFWYNAAFPSFLRNALTHAFPDRNIEVVNLGMTATNSITVLDEAREVLRYQPDAIVVYDGHNEFYGALGVASRESVGRARWMIQLYLALLRFKTFLLLRDGTRAVLSLFHASDAVLDRSTMMEKLARGKLIPYGSDLYRAGLEQFTENLHALIDASRSSGVPLVLCTQASNLRDLAPFASLHREGLDTAACHESESLLRAGRSLLAEGNVAASLQAFKKAVTMDSDYAMAHFLLARDDDSLGLDRMADTEYREARDKDPVRFRASSDFNNAIRACTGQAYIADVESVFAASSARGLIGHGLITEHLHPTVYGQFLIARAIITCMAANGILAGRNEWRLRDTVADSTIWADRIVTPLDEIIGRRKTEILTAGWPFVEKDKVLESVPRSDTLGLIAENVTRGKWSWRQAHDAAAQFYAQRRDFSNASSEMRTVALTYLRNGDAYKSWARFALRAGSYGDARHALELSTMYTPDAESQKMLGDLLLAEGNFAGAETRYRSALALSPPHALEVQTHYALGLALLKLGEWNECEQEMHTVLTLDPRNREARTLLTQMQTGRAQHP